MFSDTFRNAVLTVLVAAVLAVGPAAAATAAATPPSAAPGSLAQTGKTPETQTAEHGEGLLREHAWSTLGAIALGLIGLWWARRHTAER